MAIGNLVPWRWASLRSSRDDDRSFEVFRTEMDSLHRNIDRLLADAWGGSFAPALLSEAWTTGKITPNLDVAEDDEAFRVTVELPGMSDKDVAVTVADRTLTIRGEKKEEKERKEKEVFRRERAYGSFRRTIELPIDVDAAKIEAKFKDGVLTIGLPKTKEAQQRVKQIPVSAA
jgi:HSP20 family protein